MNVEITEKKPELKNDNLNRSLRILARLIIREIKNKEIKSNRPKCDGGLSHTA